MLLGSELPSHTLPVPWHLHGFPKATEQSSLSVNAFESPLFLSLFCHHSPSVLTRLPVSDVSSSTLGRALPVFEMFLTPQHVPLWLRPFVVHAMPELRKNGLTSGAHFEENSGNELDALINQDALFWLKYSL